MFEVFLEMIEGKDDLDIEVIEKLQHRANSLNSNYEANSKPKSYIMFTSDEKLFTLELLKHFNVYEVSELTSVPRKSIMRWSKVGHLRVKGCSKSIIPKEINNKLIQYYKDGMVLDMTPNNMEMRSLALRLCKDILPMFKASNGWWEKWRKKHFGGQKIESRLYEGSK
jgi:hypothetical protein